ncbi:protease SohB [Alcanivorax sp. 1008]|uniref:protease SohB n=1 Tax=Alcanivorax sp. 1008 TaxID=2816853 RepID=UPI001DC10FFC|nr:protease SohB [Alcanivorax sp. 1008]
MLDLVVEYGMFLAKIATVVIALLFVISGIATMAARNRHQNDDGYLKVRHLNQEIDNLRDGLRHEIMTEAESKAELKRKKKDEKTKRRAEKKMPAAKSARSRLFVLDFDGDVQASGVDNLRREISAVLQVAEANDEVVIRLESPGGLVHSYGLAASQLRRVTSQGVHLTVCVDQVAASGGYMMACIAEKIIAAPFAVVGSIGVVAQIPNFHRLLKKNDIDVELLTAGEYKRTLTMFGQNTDSDRAKFQEELEDTHVLFKDFVRDNRRGLEISKVATGEHWYGIRALELGLIDELATSDEYLQRRSKDAEVFEISWQVKRNLAERLGLGAEGAMIRVLEHLFHRGSNRLLK